MPTDTLKKKNESVHLTIGSNPNQHPGHLVHRVSIELSQFTTPWTGDSVRADMAKVIVERPRKKGNSSKKPKSYSQHLRGYGPEGPPCREGMKTRWQGRTKYLNEHLGPLRRFLNAQVGRPWDKVFSEICARINRNSAVQDHVRDHVADYVTIHTLLIDGAPCEGDGGKGHGKPLHMMPWKRWYVCPRTGLLRRVKAARKPPRKPKRPPPPRYIRVSESLQCRYFDGAWHLVTLKPLPDSRHHWGYCRSVDVLLNRSVNEITANDARRHYGAVVFAVEKRRLSRREVRQYPIPSCYWDG